MKRIYSIGFPAVCASLIFILALKIDMYKYSASTDLVSQEIPFYIRFLGEGRSILSSLSILQADIYFHGGVGHFHAEHAGGPAIIGRMKCAHVEEHPPEPGKLNIFLRMADELKITEHIHLEEDDAGEIIPWLYYAAKIDPHNITAYTTGGYWLADRMKRTGAGIDFLREGLKNNPDSWELNAELGRLYLEHLKSYEPALRFFLRARRLLHGTPHDKFQVRYVLSFLAYTYREIGEKDKALSVYRSINRLFPDDMNIIRKIDDLSA